MRATILLIPAVFVCGALFLAAVAEDATASVHLRSSECAQCQADGPAAQARPACGIPGADRSSPKCD